MALYLRDNFMSRALPEINVPKELEALWVWARPKRLPRSMTGLILCVIYFPPTSPYHQDLIDHISTSLDILQVKYPDAGTVLLGDFNRLDTDLICRLCGLTQVVDKHAGGQAIFDKILTNI